jgi:hypothetical protein
MGAAEAAVAAGEEAVRWSSPTDFLIFNADAQVAYADALETAGHLDEAQAARQRALEMYRAKGSIPNIERMTGL